MSAKLLYVFAIATIFVAAVRSEISSTPPPPPHCRPGLVVDCRLSYEDVVWATSSDNKCKVIINRCVFDNANCYRYRKGDELLKEISQEECQKLCVNDCSQEPKNRICAARNDVHLYFDSQCDLDKLICNSGEVWTANNPPCSLN